MNFNAQNVYLFLHLKNKTLKDNLRKSIDCPEKHFLFNIKDWNGFSENIKLIYDNRLITK